MKRSLLLSFILILFLSGCSMGQIEEVDQIIINEMNSFSEVKADSSVTITNSDDIEILIKGIEKAKKQPGAADVMDPEFELLIGERKFFLWLIGEGTVMDQEDTHTIYSLRNGVREKFEKIIKEEYDLGTGEIP